MPETVNGHFNNHRYPRPTFCNQIPTPLTRQWRGLEWLLNVANLTVFSHHFLRAVVSNYRESADSCKNSNFFFLYQEIPLGELFSKTIFKSSSESPVWRKIEKFKIWLNLAERRVKIMQIRAFSKRSYKTRKTCFYLKFTGFVTHFLKLLSTYILSRSMLSFHSFHSRTEVSVSYFADTVNFTGF